LQETAWTGFSKIFTFGQSTNYATNNAIFQLSTLFITYTVLYRCKM